MRAKNALSLCAFGILGGACVSESAGYREVQDVVSERAHAPVKWRRIDEDPKREQSVQDLLKQPLTKEAAVRLGLLENLDIQAKFEALRATQGKLMQARTPRNPEAEATFGFRHKQSTNVEVSVSEELTHLLFLPGANRAAEAELDAESLAVATDVIDFVFEIERALVRYQAAVKKAELQAELLGAERGQLEAARAIHAAGNITDLALLGFESSTREAEVALDGARQAASDLREALTVKLGLWGKNVNFKVAPLPEGAPPPLATDALVSRAFDRSLDLRLAKLRILAAGQDLDITRASGFVPELHGGVDAKREENLWRVGPMVKLEIPIFDHGQGPTAEKEAELFRKQRAYQGLGVKLRASARATASRLYSTRQTLIRYDQDILPIRKKILEQTELHYNAMGVDVFQLLSAKGALGHAGLARIEARLNYDLAYVDLEQLLAGRIPPSTLSRDEAAH